MSRQMSPFRFLTTFYVASSFFYDCEAHLWDSTRERYNTVVADAMIKSLRLATKWCDSEHVPSDYHELGIAQELDKCCRDLYNCPDYIPPKSWQYGIYNRDKYRRLDCNCEDKFYACLKNLSGADSIPGRIVGIVYFVFMSSWCFLKLKDGNCSGRWYYDEDGLGYNSNEKGKYFCPMFFRNTPWGTNP
uniref:phospholipase A2 n=1 Tax=Ampulex compressa TaxID=860918 RepID=A0A1W6EW14_AMPCP|nr:phospholipase A2 -like protein 3 [Ampulex compressa]